MKNAKQHLIDLGVKIEDGNYSLDGKNISRAEAREARKNEEVIIIVSYGQASYYPEPNSATGQKWADKYPK